MSEEKAAVVHAFHFCKHSDARRQDPVLIAKSLAYQLAMRFPAFRVRGAADIPAAQEGSDHCGSRPGVIAAGDDAAALPSFI